MSQCAALPSADLTWQMADWFPGEAQETARGRHAVMRRSAATAAREWLAARLAEALRAGRAWLAAFSDKVRSLPLPSSRRMIWWAPLLWFMADRAAVTLDEIPRFWAAIVNWTAITGAALLIAVLEVRIAAQQKAWRDGRKKPGLLPGSKIPPLPQILADQLAAARAEIMEVKEVTVEIFDALEALGMEENVIKRERHLRLIRGGLSDPGA